ncbi:MAG: LamG-like jellyroll fold domain-containing protein [Alphaproteobacteria bacterium]
MKDLGANIGLNGYITIPDNDAYHFGEGAFSITFIVKIDEPGTLFQKGATSGGKSHSGFSASANRDGTITVQVYNGQTTPLECVTEKTNILDEEYHHIAITRHGATLKVYYDHAELKLSGRATENVFVEGTDPIYFGGHAGAGSYAGIMEDISIWKTVLNLEERQATAYHHIDPNDPNLVGFWKLDGNYNDESVIQNTGSGTSDIEFVPVFHVLWTEGENSFSYCSIVSAGTSRPSYKENAVSETASRKQSLPIAENTPALYLALMGDEVENKIPEDALIRLQMPDGTILDKDVSEPDLMVATRSGAVICAMISKPMPGNWTVLIDAPSDRTIQLQVQTLPSGDLQETFVQTLQPLYPETSEVAFPHGPTANGYWCSLCYWGILAGVVILSLALLLFGYLAATGAAAVVAICAAIGISTASATVLASILAVLIGQEAPNIASWACHKMGACGEPPINYDALADGKARYDQYCYLTAHNSFSYRGYAFLKYTQQSYGFATQMDHGVDALMLDTHLYDPFSNAENVYLCHGDCNSWYRDFCLPDTPPTTLEDCLSEIVAYLKKDVAKKRIITIMIECRTGKKKDLVKAAFVNSGAEKMTFYADRNNQGWEVDKKGWPKRKWLVDHGYHLVAFSDRAAECWPEENADGSRKPKDDDGLPYIWQYAVESVYGNDSMSTKHVGEREGSSPLDYTKKKLFIENYFPTIDPGGLIPGAFYPSHNDSKKIIKLIKAYRKKAKRMPNFLAVDYVQMGYHHGPAKALGHINEEWAGKIK